MEQKRSRTNRNTIFANKAFTCKLCPIKENCPFSEQTGEICLVMNQKRYDILELAKKNPMNFSIKGLTNHIALMEAELSVVPRSSEKYMDVKKVLLFAYETLHKMKYGTKKTVKTTIAKVDINTLVDQADQAEQEIKDEDGETIAIVSKKKKKKQEVVA